MPEFSRAEIIFQAGTQMEKAANDLGLTFWAELYGDVRYDNSG